MHTPLAGITLRDYQRDAIDQIHALYTSGQTRASVTLPCGTGKSAVAAAITADATTTCLFVPTIALLSQTCATYQNLLPGHTVIAVCQPRRNTPTPTPDTFTTDFTTDDISADQLTDILTNIAVTTDPDTLAELINTYPRPLLVVSTFASAPTIAAATAISTLTWDLIVCDEAHRTAGAANKTWAIMLHDQHIPAHRRLFTTATARLIQPPDTTGDEPIEIASMNDPALYGPVLPALSVRDAITAGWLSDYQVAIVAVTDTAVTDAITQAHKDGHILDKDAAAAQLALLHTAATTPDLDSILVFHNRIDQSRRWAQQMRTLAAIDPAGPDTRVFHIDAHTARAHRTTALNALSHPNGALTIVSNVAVLAEGIDVPSLAAVLFAAPRTSTADITQIVGRALRRHPQHPDRKAVVIIPVIEPSGADSADPDTRVMRSGYYAAWTILAALAEDDPLLYQSLLQIRIDDPHHADTPTSRVRVDTSMLPANLADGFTLRVLERTTSGHAETARRLHNFWARTHHTNPPSAYRDHDGYPLRRRLTEARKAYRDDRLPRHVIDQFELIPGFTWTPDSRAARHSIEQMLDVIAHYVQVTGATSIPAWVTTIDPDTGISMRIGAWLANLPRLDTDQQRRLKQLLPAQLHT